jgi:hypothetical protein
MLRFLMIPFPNGIFYNIGKTFKFITLYCKVNPYFVPTAWYDLNYILYSLYFIDFTQVTILVRQT